MSDRLPFIDRVRGIAAMVMVCTHAANALLADSYRHNAAWNVFTLLAGFAAPAFLLLSGVALWLSFMRRNDGRVPEKIFHLDPIVYRSLRLLFIGYWLQIPILSLRQMIWAQRPAELARMFDANILQIIALSSLFAFALLRLVRDRRTVNIVMTAVVLALIGATPYLLQSGLRGDPPLPIRAYFAPQPSATFPLFPFAAYLLAGVAAAPVLMVADKARKGWLWVAVVALGLLLCSFGIDELLQLGGVLFIIALCMIIPRRDGGSVLERFGARSLAIYVLHLGMIYGSPVNAGLARWYAAALDPLTVGIVAVIAAGGSYAIARSWERLRRDRGGVAVWMKRLWWMVFWGIFLLNP